MERNEERRYEHLSPFELKDMLVRLAARRSERMMLNAGRGNPNWLALRPRQGFMQLLRFALEESERAALGPDLGGLPRGDFRARFEVFAERNCGDPGMEFLRRGVAYAERDPVTLVEQARFGEAVEEVGDACGRTFDGKQIEAPGRRITSK